MVVGAGSAAARVGRPRPASFSLSILLLLVLICGLIVRRAAALGEAEGIEVDARGTYKKTVLEGPDGAQVQEGVLQGELVEFFGKGYLVTLATAGCAE